MRKGRHPVERQLVEILESSDDREISTYLLHHMVAVIDQLVEKRYQSRKAIRKKMFRSMYERLRPKCFMFCVTVNVLEMVSRELSTLQSNDNKNEPNTFLKLHYEVKAYFGRSRSRKSDIFYPIADMERL